MKYFAESLFNYARRQIVEHEEQGKLIFVMPTFPPPVVMDVGDRLTKFVTEGKDVQLIIKTASALVNEWRNEKDYQSREIAQKLTERGWADDRGNLTVYRNITSGDGRDLVLLLIGVDRVTDSASLEDFHRCDMNTVWDYELERSFGPWVAAVLKDKGVGYDGEETIEHFDLILKPLVKHGLADILQISTLLEEVDFSLVQDGRDAENLLLRSLRRFELPRFGRLDATSSGRFDSYIKDAVDFFSYDSFLDDNKRKKARTKVDNALEFGELNEKFDFDEDSPFNDEKELAENMKQYIAEADQDAREKLFDCDFVNVRDGILKSKKSNGPPKPKRETVQNLSGGPIEVVLSGIWRTLKEFKKEVFDESTVLPHEALKEINIHSNTFRHDCDGESSIARTHNGGEYIHRLLGGVDDFIEKYIDTSRMSAEHITVNSGLLRSDLSYRFSRNADPYLEFTVSIKGEGVKDVSKRFRWYMPEIHPYRVADELIRWGAEVMNRYDDKCLPVFNVPYYEEFTNAQDDEETSRVLLQCINGESGKARDLLDVESSYKKKYPFRELNDLAVKYEEFIVSAANKGLHSALLSGWDDLRKTYEQACERYTSSKELYHVSAILFRSFLIVEDRNSDEDRDWMWRQYEPSCAVTVLHPALLEMLQAHIIYLFTAFSSIAADELKKPGKRSFDKNLWQDYIDLAAIQEPLSGLIKDSDRLLDTNTRGKGLIHRVGSVRDSQAMLTTRLLRDENNFEEEDISQTDLFRESRESRLIKRILRDYKKVHPHATDGLSIAVYQQQDIQPLIAAVDDYLKDICKERPDNSRPYAMSVTVFTESTDDSSVARWIRQWKERWEAAETEESLLRYRTSNLSVSHRIITADDNYRQFTRLIKESLNVDIAILMGFMRAGSEGNKFVAVDEAYDVRSRTLKFPILEKSFCSVDDPGKKLCRARILSNRQFRINAYHSEIMARLNNPEASCDSEHVVMGYGDYAPWQKVIDALHKRVEWVVCIDPNIDRQLIEQTEESGAESREIIGFGSGVGMHGEANYTISTEQFKMSDVLHKLQASIREVYVDWSLNDAESVARSVIKESQRLSGLSLIRATGIGHYIHHFMAYSLTRKLSEPGDNILCDNVVSLDAYSHWFDTAETERRPDMLWVTARIKDKRLELEMRVIECKLARRSDAPLEEAYEQLKQGISRLASVFKPHGGTKTEEDERPDQRYWWLQLHRLVASQTKSNNFNRKELLTALERLAEGDFDVDWQAAAFTYWTDSDADMLVERSEWSCMVEGQEVDIGIVEVGSEAVKKICENSEYFSCSWPWKSASFKAAKLPIDVADTCVPESDDDPEVEEIESDADSEMISKPIIEEQALEAGSPVSTVSTADSIDPEGTSASEIPDRVLLGETTSGKREVYWEFGNTDMNNRHMLIFGTSGMGKTYTIQCLLYELGQSGQNSLIVDYTNGFFDNQLEEAFKRGLNPIQHLVKMKPLGINPFRQQLEMLPEHPADTAQRVRGVFGEVYKLGDQQKSALYQAIKEGIEEMGASAMTLEDLIPRLELIVENKGAVGQAASSVISKIRPFIDQNPFGEEISASWQELFTDDTHKCHIIQLTGFGKDAAKIITEFSLIDLYRFYRSSGTEKDARVVVLDEVQSLDHREESPLAQLLREGRKFGFSLILATQIMSNLSKDERDRLFNAAHKLFFRPADTEMRTYADIAARTAGGKVDSWEKKLSSLNKGECYSLGPSLNESTGKLETKVFKIKISSLEERSKND